MNDQLEQFFKKHADTIVGGSIEEASLHTAVQIFDQGQQDVARQIVQSLLIDGPVKQEFLDLLNNNTAPMDTPEPSVPTPPPVPATPVAPVPLPTPPPLAESYSVVTEQDISAQPLPQEPLQEIVPPAPIIPVLGHVEQNQETSEPEDISGKDNETFSSPYTVDADKDMWKRFEEIVANEQGQEDTIESSEETPVDTLSQIQRVEALQNAIPQAAEAVEQQQDKEVLPVYDKIFDADMSHTNDFQVPGVIKTYEEAADVSERREQEAEQQLQERLNRQQIYFKKSEDYLTRAYAAHHQDVIISARRQFESLQDRYPEYVEHRQAHVADIQKIIDEHENIEVTAHDEYVLGDMVIAPGMRVSGSADSYVVSGIKEHGGTTDVVFTSDQEKTIFHVPVERLEQALQDHEHTDVDEFFEAFKV